MVNRGRTQFNPNRTTEIVIPVPTLDQYEGFEMHMVFSPSWCGTFDRDGLSAIADRLERDAKSMEISPYWITPNDLRWYAQRIREVIGKADAEEVLHDADE